MTAFLIKALCLVGLRLLIVTVSAALLCTFTEQQVFEPRKPLTLDFIETASIVEAPTTIGSADSELYWRSKEDIDKTLDTLQAMGVNTIRIGIPWAGVQIFNAPFYYWNQVDLMVNAAVERNMGVLAAVNTTPIWFGWPLYSAHFPPEAYAEFIGLVAERYKGKISAYEVWNEPNTIFFQNPVDPVFYTRLLQAAYPAIKAADPEATVVGGVLLAAYTAGSVTINPQDFVATMYENGAKGYFDAISYHPYHPDIPFSESGIFLRGALTQYREMRQVMDLNGDDELKIWISEYGLPTGTFNGTTVDEAYQAEFIEDLLSFWPTVNGTERPEGPIYIYTTRDFASGDPNLQYNFGFFYTDWTPKQAAYIIAQYAGGLVEPPPEGPARPIIDAAIALARTIVDASVRVINAGYDLFKAAVDITVQVIRGLIDLSVRVVRGLAQVSVAVITGIVDAVGAVIDGITDRFGPDDGTTPENETLRVLRTDTQLSDEPPADIAPFALTTGDLTETDGSEPQTEFTDAEDGTQGLDDKSTETTESDETTEGPGAEDETTGTEDETTDTTGSKDDTTGSKDETTGSEDDAELTESNTSTTTQGDTKNTESGGLSGTGNSEGANQTTNSSAGGEQNSTAPSS